MSQSWVAVLEFRPAPKASKRMLQAHGFLAELFVDDKVDPPIHHYVVMRKGSVEILGWGQELSAEAAERQARHCIETLSCPAQVAG